MVIGNLELIRLMRYPLYFAYEKVQKIAEEIQAKSMVLSNECIDDNPPSPLTVKIQLTFQWLIVMAHNYESSI